MGDSMKRTVKHVSYAMGNFANTIAYQVFGNRIQFYYVDILGLNAATAGVLWTIYGLWNAINDPLMGQLSDRTLYHLRRDPAGAVIFLPMDADPTAAVDAGCVLFSHPVHF